MQRATTAAFLSSGGMGQTAPERLFYSAMQHVGGARIPTRWPLSDFFEGLQHADLDRASLPIAPA